jgi:hypothetical protein
VSLVSAVLVQITSHGYGSGVQLLEAVTSQGRRPNRLSAQLKAYSLDRRSISRHSHFTRSHASLIGSGARRRCWLLTQVSYVVCIHSCAKGIKILIGLTVRSGGGQLFRSVCYQLVPEFRFPLLTLRRVIKLDRRRTERQMGSRYITRAVVLACGLTCHWLPEAHTNPGRCE